MSKKYTGAVLRAMNRQSQAGRGNPKLMKLSTWRFLHAILHRRLSDL